MNIVTEYAIGFMDALFSNKKAQFIQIGVNDGVNADFLRTRVIKNSWHGLLIEPHPHYFQLAQRAWAGYKSVVWEQVAVSNQPGINDLHYIKEVPEDRSWALGIASFDREHVIRCGFKEEDVGSVPVNSVTLESLVNKYCLFKPDLVIIDVEGHEFNVLKSADFGCFRPKLVILETKHMSRELFDGILELFPDGYQGVYMPDVFDGVIYDTLN
jgi:FkbM family methyltransferase